MSPTCWTNVGQLSEPGAAPASALVRQRSQSPAIGLSVTLATLEVANYLLGVTVELRELIGRIAATYDRQLGQQGEAQALLRQQASEVLSGLLAADLMPVGSGGKGNAAVVPWISIFDPDETTSAQRGMYVVYLFAADMSTVSLSLNQGVTELVDRFGTREGRVKLASQAAAIRSRLPKESILGLDETIDLKSNQQLPRNYEAGNIAARTYRSTELPSNQQMVADLRDMVRLYRLALEVRDALRLSTPDAVVTTREVQAPEPTVEFKPKNDADYVQHFERRIIRKSRRHERVLKDYGTFLQGRGFTPNTNVHPRDLTATKAGQHWLIEVKMVYRGDGVQATRDALSQLLMYRDFLYQPTDQVHMLAVFSEDVGALNVEFLEKHQIASTWKEQGSWVGSPAACAAGLAATAGL